MRRHAAEIWMLADAEIDQLDRLSAELRGGFRDQRHFEALEERAIGIGDRLRAAFRGKRPA